MVKNRIKVETKDQYDKDIVLFVKRPTAQLYREAQLVGSKVFRDAIDSGAMLKVELDSYMKQRDIWNDVKQKELVELNKRIIDSYQKLKAGGIKLLEGRKIALDIRLARLKRTVLVAERDKLDQFTVESQVEDAKFDFLVSTCVFNEDGNLFFENLDAYQQVSDKEYAINAARALGQLLYDIEDKWEHKLPENEFLIKYKFANDDLNLVDTDGNRVDIDFNMINEDFQLVNSDGKPINQDGNLIDEYGLPIVDTSPFLDEDGNPIQE